ncbi:MAG: hypothetical protein GX801_02030 [Fibrobacter sp.]|nr:hypothetical protein [Fibrobacter sp.]
MNKSKKIINLLIAAVFTIVLASCGGGGSTGSGAGGNTQLYTELDKGVIESYNAKWEANKPEAYTFSIKMTDPSGPGTADVSCEAGACTVTGGELGELDAAGAVALDANFYNNMLLALVMAKEMMDEMMGAFEGMPGMEDMEGMDDMADAFNAEYRFNEEYGFASYFKTKDADTGVAIVGEVLNFTPQ